MLRCNFDKVAWSFIEITFQYGCCPVYLLHYISEHLLLRITLKGCFCRTCNYSNKEYKILHTFALKLHYNCLCSCSFLYETGGNKGEGAGLENVVLCGLL